VRPRGGDLGGEGAQAHALLCVLAPHRCIVPWLTERSNACPMCKDRVIPSSRDPLLRPLQGQQMGGIEVMVVEPEGSLNGPVRGAGQA
jgi:hypothetical protein